MNIIQLFKPTLASLAFGLFFATNAACVWGGVFPFLPLEFQTHEILLWFFLSQSNVFVLAFVASAFGAYFLPRKTKLFFVRLVSLIYFTGWVFLIAAMYLDVFALLLVVLGGAFLGVGSTGFYMLWQRLFASQESEVSTNNLVLGIAWSAVFYFVLHAMPQAVTAYLIPLVALPLFSLCLFLECKRIDLHQAMFEDVPREHKEIYQSCIKSTWRANLTVGAFGLATGIMRSFAVAEPEVGSLVNVLSMACLFVVAVVTLAVWNIKNIRLNVIIVYRTTFPFFITGLFILPFAGEVYLRWLAAIMYALYSLAIIIMMIHCAQISRDEGVNPVFVFGFSGSIVFLMHNLGFVGGVFVPELTITSMNTTTFVSLVAIFILSLIFFVCNGGFNYALYGKGGIVEFIHKREKDHARPKRMPQILLKELGGEEASGLQKGHGEIHEEGVGPSEASPVLDKTPDMVSSKEPLDVPSFAERIEWVREEYGLTARETEIMSYIAQGNTVPHIAAELVVSENTVRTHSKRIYTKLDIHKKQELIDLINNAF